MDELSATYVRDHGQCCARVRLTAGQAWAYALSAALVVGLFAFFPARTAVAASYALALFFFASLAVRLAAIAMSGRRGALIRVSAEELRSLKDEDLPSYSVLVPLFREPEVVPSLLKALNALDYPKDKLDIQILLEPEDSATLEALGGTALPQHVRITMSPGGAPRTKPRGCNYGLSRARGELVVIYDAEDRPEPDQLKKAAAAYRRMPDSVVCLQCRLDHYNSMQTIFSRWSSMEYLIWYRAVLPGLGMIGAPLPLGGTSNHLRRKALVELGGWDPFNVTEDCDLGMRIARRKWKTLMLDSTTWEESVTSAWSWIRQRSRWVKGYLQTWLVHSRKGSMREFGLRQWLLFFLLTGGGAVTLVLNPVMWLVVAAWLAVGWPIVDITSPFSIAALCASMSLLAANVVFVGINMVECLVRGRPELVSAALLAPVEWLLLSLAAWKAFLEFLVRPFHWEKTSHGFAEDRSGGPERPKWLEKAAFPALAFVFLALWTAGLLLFISPRVEKQLEPAKPYEVEQIPPLFAPEDYAAATIPNAFEQAAPALCGPLQANASFPGDVDFVLVPFEDWSAYKGVAVNVVVSGDAPQGMQVMFHVKDRDRLWYQQRSPQLLIPGRRTRVEADLRPDGAAWAPRGHPKPCTGYSWRHVREFGIRVYGGAKYRGPVQLADVRLVPRSEQEMERKTSLAVARLEQNARQLKQYDKFEATLDLSKDYSNPFDPRIVNMIGIFATPGGKTLKVPGFFWQDCLRTLDGKDEKMTQTGAARWKVRFCPTEAGVYSYRVKVTDSDGCETTTDAETFSVAAGGFPGFIRVSARNPRYFERDDGSFFYPIGHNICFPSDPLQAHPYFSSSQEDNGTYSYDRYMDRMSRNGENWARIRMSHWWLGLEGPPEWTGFHGVGRYSMENAARIDHLVDLAAEKDMYIQLTFQHYSEFNQSWASNPYSAAAGGMLDRPIAFFTDARAKKAFRDRARYIVARWGYSPHIMAWELWGEVNLMPDYRNHQDIVADWHREMFEFLRSNDPWSHMVFTHCHNWQHGYALWPLRQVECVQGNGYIRPPNLSVDHNDNFRRYISEVWRYDKPILVAEYGGKSELGSPSADYLEAQLHSGLWASFCQCFAGAAMHWWWNFIDQENLYTHYKALAAFSRGIDRLSRDFLPVAPAVASGSGETLKAAGMQADTEAFFWVYHPSVCTTLKDIPVVSGSIMNVSGLKPGAYSVEYWNTYDGTVIGGETLENKDRLSLRLPPVHRDIAVKVRKAGG